MGKFKQKLLSFSQKYPTFTEFIRFVIIGGFSTLIDMFVMGVVLYIFQPNNYPNFFNVFYGATLNPSTISTIIGTGLGFICGLVFNYIFSILFVFNNKGNSKSIKGFVIFAVFSLIGLFIHLFGMYLGYDVLGINEWIVKITLTLVVLVYNYLTRKFVIFKKNNDVNKS